MLLEISSFTETKVYTRTKKIPWFQFKLSNNKNTCLKVIKSWCDDSQNSNDSTLSTYSAADAKTWFTGGLPFHISIVYCKFQFKYYLNSLYMVSTRNRINLNPNRYKHYYVLYTSKQLAAHEYWTSKKSFQSAKEFSTFYCIWLTYWWFKPKVLCLKFFLTFLFPGSLFF